MNVHFLLDTGIIKGMASPCLEASEPWGSNHTDMKKSQAQQRARARTTRGPTGSHVDTLGRSLNDQISHGVEILQNKPQLL